MLRVINERLNRFINKMMKVVYKELHNINLNFSVNMTVNTNGENYLWIHIYTDEGYLKLISVKVGVYDTETTIRKALIRELRYELPKITNLQ